MKKRPVPTTPAPNLEPPRAPYEKPTIRKLEPDEAKRVRERLDAEKRPN